MVERSPNLSFQSYEVLLDPLVEIKEPTLIRLFTGQEGIGGGGGGGGFEHLIPFDGGSTACGAGAV